MMASRRVLSSNIVARLSSLSLVRPTVSIIQHHPSANNRSRYFSGKNGNDDDNNEDPFGVNFNDGDDHGKLGPSSGLPPKYRRDAATGKFTGEVEAELTAEDNRLLKMDEIEKERVLMERLVDQWEESEKNETGEPKKQSVMADRIREEEMALNTLGRSAQAQSARGITEDGEEAYQDNTGFSQPLSPDEYLTFQEYMKKEYNTELEDGSIPMLDVEKETAQKNASDNPDMDLTWMSASAQQVTDGSEENDPFLDLMPSDFTPARLVNRRNAKPIPRELIHHNNLSLLRRYVTPAGAIMSRVQSRLGAKDQRKISKLIKRARHLGLIPYMGQWKFENHGSIYEKDINEEKDWEKELTRRGLVKRSDQKTKNNDE